MQWRNWRRNLIKYFTCQEGGPCPLLWTNRNDIYCHYLWSKKNWDYFFLKESSCLSVVQLESQNLRLSSGSSIQVPSWATMAVINNQMIRESKNSLNSLPVCSLPCSQTLKTSLWNHESFQEVTRPPLTQTLTSSLVCSWIKHVLDLGFPSGSAVKTPPAEDAEDTGFIPRSGRFPGGGHGNPLVFLPVEPYGLRSLTDYSPYGREESDTTEVTEQHAYRELSSGRKRLEML